MWKIGVAFAVFSALAIYMLLQGGEIDMSGEKHGIDTHQAVPEKSDTAAAPKH